MSRMRGIRVSEFGGPDVLKYVTDLPIPAKPTGRQLLIRVKCIGVNPVDTYVRSGMTHAIRPELPYTPGIDGSGIVEDIGESVTKFKKGNRVCWARTVTGCYAELALVNEWETFHLHDDVSFQQGAAIGVSYGTAYKAIRNVKLRPGETVFVHGASGSIGLASCQIARSLGATVVGTAGTEQGMRLILSNGAHLAFNHRDEGYIDKIKASVKGFDVIIEMLANVNLEKDLELIGLGGRLAIVGSRGMAELTPRAVMTNEVNVIGVGLYRATEEEYAEMGAFFLAGQEQGWLRPIVGQEFTLDQAEQSHVEVIEHKHGSNGKIVINV